MGTTVGDGSWPRGGEVGEHVRAFDWGTTPLGSIDTWPPSHRAVVELVLATGFPAVLAWGPALTVCAYNAAYRPLLGDATDPLGRPFPEVWPEPRDLTAPRLQAVLAGETVSVDGARFRLARYGRPDEAWFDYSLGPVWDGAGAVAGVLAVAVETTRRVRAAAALRTGEARFRAVWEATSDALALSDPDGTVLAANPAYLGLYDYGEDEVVGRSFAVIFPEEQRAWAEEQYRAVFADPSPPPAYEARVRRKDGTERRVEARADFVVEDGRRTALVSAIRDVTERVRAEERLAASEERFRTLIGRSADAVQLVDTAGTILYSSDSVAAVLGYRPEEIAGRGVAPYIHPDDLSGVLAWIAEVAATPGGVGSRQYRVRHKDGAWVWVETTIANHLDTPNINAIVGNFRDVTARKAAEAEREAFADAAAHDLKTPLTALRGQAQLLLRRARAGRLGDGAALEAGLVTIDGAGGRMVALIDEMMDATHLRAGRSLELNLGPTDLAALAGEAADEARQSAPRHTVRVEADGTELVGDWDEARLRRVLGNLLGNAVKYSPGGGAVRVCVGREADAEGKWGVVTVRDEGMGIPAEDLPRVFERFHRGGNVGRIGGTGIGLFGARRIVEQHGGTVTVESEEGRGSTFTVRLPLGPGDDRGEREAD